MDIPLNVVQTELINILQSLPAFENMPQEDIINFGYRVDRKDKVKICLPNETVIEQGKTGKNFYLTLRGELAAYDMSDGEAKKKLLNFLHAGEFFGMRVLLNKDAKREAAVVAQVDSIVVSFSEEDWLWLIKTYPPAEKAFQDREAEYDARAKLNFKGRQDDEIVYEIVRRHFLALIDRLIKWPAAILAIPVVILVVAYLLGVPFSTTIFSTWFIMVLVPSVLLPLFMTIYHYLDWRNDELIITSKRVIQVERVLLLSDAWRESPLTKIQNVAVASQNWMDVLFDVDDIVIQTAAVGEIKMDTLPYAHKLGETILDAQNRERERQTAQDVSKIRGMLAQNIYQDILAKPISKPPKPAIKKRAFPKVTLPRPDFTYYIPKIKLEDKQSVTWRKHYFVLLQHVCIPASLFLIFTFLLAGAFFAWWPFSAPAAFSIKLMLGLLLFASFVWYTFEYDAWRRDIYVVTNDKIIDVESSSFKIKGENIRAGSFDGVQTITYTIPNWFEKLLNLGDVVIETAAQGNFTFVRVFDPSAVQKEIFSRWNTYQEAARAKQHNNTNVQIVTVTGEYDRREDWKDMFVKPRSGK